jgi:hypothetical protein
MGDVAQRKRGEGRKEKEREGKGGYEKPYYYGAEA